MKKAIFFLISLLLITTSLSSAPIIFKYDNGIPGGFYSQSSHLNWDETDMLKPPGPCKINKVQIYLSGSVAAPDTVWIVGDPAEGAYPPSSYCWYINKLTDGKIINYTGTPGWFEIDITSDNIKADGLCSVVIQHRIKSNGPYFTVDNQPQTSAHSWLIDPRANPNFYNIGGTIFSQAQGNYMVRFEVEYDFPDGETTAMAPPPILVDVTKEAGLVDGNGNPIKSATVSVVGFNNSEFDDLAIGSFYFSNNGNGSFTNKSSQVNLQAAQSSWADIDNDGKIDYFALNTMGNDKILWGNGDYTFIDETDPGIKLNQPTVTPMFFDYNHDGLLDLFIAYGRTSDAGGNETYYPDQLFKNRDNREFENVTNTAGISAGEPPPYYDCWGASICDYNNDNWPDAFVATYRLAPDMLFKNAKNGMFDEVGGTTSARGIPTYYAGYFGHGMGSDWGDFNNDGYDDLCVGNLGHPDSRALNSNPSLLFKNNGAPNYTFTDMHSEMGLKFFEMNAGTVWADLDLDGYLDLVHAQYSYEQKGAGANRYTRFYLNQGPDKNYKLKDITWESGAYSHGAWTPVRLDYDNDGDMDIIVASSNDVLKLFRNDMPIKGNWIAFRLVGNPSDGVPLEGFGTNVTVYAGGKYYRSLPGTVMNGRCSQSSNELNFGIGSNTIIDSVVIKYPNGQVNKFTGIAINTKYKIPYMQSPVRMRLTAPMLITPINYSRHQLTETTLEWSQVSEGTMYETIVSNSSIFSDTITYQKSGSKSFLFLAYANNKTYYWKVRAYTDSDTSNWSSVWEFTVGVPLPSVPTLKSPTNDSLNVSAKTKFIWNSSKYEALYPGKTNYDLQICEDPQCSTLVNTYPGLIDTTLLLTEPLNPDSKYYWRTRGLNEGQPSNWSDIWNFTVMALPSKPILTLPANGDTAVKTKPSLSWEESTNADYYSLEISKSVVFNIDSIDYQVSDITSTSRKLFKTLEEGTIYYWHVRAGNDGGESEWSDAYNFKTEGILGIDEKDNKGIFVKTSPNPFDKVTNIEFNLYEPGFTTLKIFNLDGIELETILSEKIDAGNHLVKWDAKAHPTGLYYYQLIIGNKSYTGKLIVLK